MKSKYPFPKNTLLGNLALHEEYEYYDRPLLFSCKNEDGTLFLVSLTDWENSEYTYVEVSGRRLYLLDEGRLSIRDAFLTPEEGALLVRQISRDEVYVIQPSDVGPDLPPDLTMLV